MPEEKIFDLIKSGDLAELRDYVASQQKSVNATNEMGIRPLMLAQYYGRTEMVALLTPLSQPLSLFEAAAVGEIETVRRIATSGSSVISGFSPDGFTALHLAAFFNQPAIALYLIEQRADVNVLATNGSQLRPIHSAVAGKNIEIVRALLKAKAEVNQQQGGGFTPLHGAVQIGDTAMVKLLLEYGADRTIAADDGKLPVDFASGDSKSAIVDLLR